MKRLAFSLFSSLVLASPAFALVGGPWDNNMYFGRDINGTYQGTITGKNISGITLFGITSGSQIGAGSNSDIGIYGNAGRALIFVNGNLVTCDVTSVADLPGRSLTMAINGSVGFGATDTAQVTETTTSTSSVSITTTTYTLTGASQISSVVDSKIVRTFPEVEFAGKGTLDVLVSTNLVQSPSNTAPFIDSEHERFDIRVSGIRTSTTNPFILGSLTWFTPEIDTTTTTTTVTTGTTTTP